MFRRRKSEAGSHATSSDSNKNGSSASNLKSKKEMQKIKQESMATANQSIANIRKFAESSWASNCIESLRLLLASREPREFFAEFLKTEYSENNLEFYDAVLNLIPHATTGVPVTAGKSTPEAPEAPDTTAASTGTANAAGAVMVPFAQAKEVYDKFIAAGSERQVNLMRNVLFTEPSTSEFVDASFLIQAKNDILKLMALDTYPRFLRSSYAQAMNLTLAKNGKKKAVEQSRNLQTLQQLLRAGQQEMDAEPDPLVISTFGTAANFDMGSIRWLIQFAAMAELLPSCIVISDMRTAGVPIVYANKAFSDVTQYSKSEIVGRNCRFLQGPETDERTVNNLRKCLRNGREFYTEIVNYRKDKSKFRNFLSLKPVWSSEIDQEILKRPALDNKTAEEMEELHPEIVRKHLLFFIGVQFVIPEHKNIDAKVLQHEALLRLLPATINLR